MRPRFVAAILLVPALVLGVSGCGGDDGPSVTAAVGTTAVLPAEDVTAASTTALATTVVVTAAPTTVATTAATEPPTTAAPTTTEEPAPLPTPAPPPADDRPAAAGDELGRIVIPRLGIDAPMHQGVDLTTLDLGPGHWPGSALPGQVGNVVIAGHRVSHTRPFRYIDRLQVGDTVVFQVGGRSFTYRMTSSEIVTPDRIDITDPTPTPTATLFACHPPGSTQYRYVVRLALVTG